MHNAGVVYELAFPALLVVYFDPVKAAARLGIEMKTDNPEDIERYVAAAWAEARQYMQDLTPDNVILHPADVETEVVTTHALPPLAAYARLHPHLMGKQGGLALYPGYQASGGFSAHRAAARQSILLLARKCEEGEGNAG